jgi:hypothetical protein
MNGGPKKAKPGEPGSRFGQCEMRTSLKQMLLSLTVLCVGLAVGVRIPNGIAPQWLCQVAIFSFCILWEDWARWYLRMSAVGWGLNAAAGGPHVAYRMIDTFSSIGSLLLPTIWWVLLLAGAIALLPWTARTTLTNWISVWAGAGCLLVLWLICVSRSDVMIAFYSGNSALLFSIVVCLVSESSRHGSSTPQATSS